MVDRHDDDSQFAPYWRTLPQVGAFYKSLPQVGASYTSCPALPAAQTLNPTLVPEDTLPQVGAYIYVLPTPPPLLCRALPCPGSPHPPRRCPALPCPVTGVYPPCHCRAASELAWASTRRLWGRACPRGVRCTQKR